MSQIHQSIGNLEMIVRGVALKVRPEPKSLLDATMRVLAEEDRLESMLGKAGAKERKEIEEALEKIRNMKQMLLRVYFASMLMGEFKPKYVSAISSLGRRKPWYPLQRTR